MNFTLFSCKFQFTPGNGDGVGAKCSSSLKNDDDDKSLSSLDEEYEQMRKSLNGNDASSISSSDANTPKKGVSIKQSLTVHSSEFYDYLNCPYAYHFHTCLIKQDLLESAASDMPKDASGNSEATQTAAYRSGQSDLRSTCESETNRKKTPLVQAATEFAKIFTPMLNQGDSSASVKNSDEEDAQLQAAVKRMHEASAMADSMSSLEDEASQLMQACKKRMIEKVKLLMKTDEKGKLINALFVMLLTN